MITLNNNKKFCLYKKETGSSSLSLSSLSLLEDSKKEGEEPPEITVSVVSTNLDDEQEGYLKKHVIQKASKNLIYKTGSIHALHQSTPSSPPKGSSSPSLSSLSPSLVSFMALLELAGEHLDDTTSTAVDEDDSIVAPKRSSREYYICFLCEIDNDHSLSLFHTELKTFADQLIPLLQQHKGDSGQEELKSSITAQASSWYWTCVEYLPRCIRLLGPTLEVILHSILLGKRVSIVAPHPLFDDISKLLLLVSIVNLSPSQAQREEEGEDEGDDDVGRLAITCARDVTTPATTTSATASDYADVQVSLSSKETNGFCTSWADKLRSGPADPFKLRMLIEELKLRVIQELNFIRKIVDQAKLSNHLLYKSYLVLRSNNNYDVLLNLLTKDITNDTTTTEVLEVISEYILLEETALNDQAGKVGHVF